MAGRGGGRSRAKTPSFLEVWGRTYPLREAWVRAAFLDGGAELDVFAETEGRRPAGLCLEGLSVPGVRSLEDLAGRTIIDPPPALLRIGGPARGPAPDVADPVGAEAEGLFEEDGLAEEDGEASEVEEPLSERSAYIAGEQFAVERLRLELGEVRRRGRGEKGGDRIEALLHLEAVAYGEDGEVSDFEVPLVCVLRARLEAV